MVHHNDLEIGCKLAGYSGHKRKKLADGRLVLVAKPIDRALIGVPIGRVVRLGWLIQDQESRHRPSLLSEPPV